MTITIAIFVIYFYKRSTSMDYQVALIGL